MTLGERIKTRRHELGLSLDKLCNKIRLSKGFLSDLENDRRGVSFENMQKISRALGMDLNKLNGAGREEKPQQWEYLMCDFTGFRKPGDDLNSFGAQGWELVAVKGEIFIFKRQK